MTRRFIATLAVVALSASPAAAQSAGTYAAPRTPDGQPDLQGMWNNETLTPFERPTSMADKAFLTEEEAAARNRQSDERRAAADAASEVRTEPLPVGGNIGGYNQFWFDPGRRVLSTRQTAMVVDPPDGRVPVKPWAVAARAHNLAHVGDSYVHMSVWDDLERDTARDGVLCWRGDRPDGARMVSRGRSMGLKAPTLPHLPGLPAGAADF